MSLQPSPIVARPVDLPSGAELRRVHEELLMVLALAAARARARREGKQAAFCVVNGGEVAAP